MVSIGSFFQAGTDQSFTLQSFHLKCDVYPAEKLLIDLFGKWSNTMVQDRPFYYVAKEETK